MIDDHAFFTWSNLKEKNLTFLETFWKCQCELYKLFHITQTKPFYVFMDSLFDSGWNKNWNLYNFERQM